MPKRQMNLKLARAAAYDAGNRNAAKAGRDKWTKEDYDVAVAEFDRLCREFDLVETITTGSGDAA